MALFLLIFIIFIICIHIQDKIETRKSQQGYEKEFGTRDREIQRIVSEAKETKIEIVDFEEKGELDEEGYLKKLTLKMKINSNKNIVITSPFHMELFIKSSNSNSDGCFYTQYTPPLKTIIILKDMS